MHLPIPLTAWLVARASSLLHSTLDIKTSNRALLEKYARKGQSAIVALWHDELFCLCQAGLGLPFVALASMSKDGDLISEIMKQKGFSMVRGSSSRGGASALSSLIRYIEHKKLMPTIVVDGPRGPWHKAKPGAIFLAHKTGVPLVPVRAIAHKAWKLGSWDRFQIPKPFSRIDLHVGEPYHIERNKLTHPVVAEECTILTERLNQLRPA